MMDRFLRPNLVRSGFVRTPDRVHLYWRAVGQGPLLVCCNGVGVSTFFWKYLVDHFSDRYTVVLWDYRGHGRNEKRLDLEHTDFSIGRHAEDLQLVLDSVRGGDEPVIVAGHSMGCQVALEYHRRYPQRVRALILQQGTAGHVLDTFYGNPRSPLFIGALKKLAFKAGRASNLFVRPLLLSPAAELVGFKARLVDPDRARREDLENYLRHLGAMDQRVFLACVWEAQLHSCWETLPQIQVPVLVIAAEHDTFTPIACSRRVAREIPGADLLELMGATHAALIEQPQTINERLERFFAERLGDGAQTGANQAQAAK